MKRTAWNSLFFVLLLLGGWGITPSASAESIAPDEDALASAEPNQTATEQVPDEAIASESVSNESVSNESVSNQPIASGADPLTSGELAENPASADETGAIGVETDASLPVAEPGQATVSEFPSADLPSTDLPSTGSASPDPESGSPEPMSLSDLQTLEGGELGTGEAVDLGQLTSVSQLSDVQPSDWAYQALQSLVERYGCIVGYPDSTYRGNSALTRYEFAAGVNACLDRMTELLADATSNLATEEDLQTLQRLQEEFAAELASLRGRVDVLEGRVATLEEQQFSTTTVLRGNVWFNVTQAFTGGDILAERSPLAPNSAFAPPIRDADNRPSRVERDQPQLTGSYYTWLTFNTSFTGQDALITQLAVGNSNSPANQLVSAGFFNSWGVPFLDQTGTPTANEFVIRELFYSFPIGDDFQVDVGPRLNYYRYFDGNRYTFFLTGASSFNSSGSTLLNAVDRGAGLVLRWDVADSVSLTLGYLAEGTEFLNPSIFNTSSDPNNGLFNSTNTISAQVAFAPSSNLTLRLIYARSSLKPYNGFIGGAVGEPLPYGYADDGFGGTLRDSGADAFVANFDWTITDWVGIFGRYSYGRMDINPTNEERSEGEIRVQSFQIGLGFPDLFQEGALGVLSFVVPHDYLEGRRFLLAGGGDGGTQYELEASYRYPLNDYISLVPSFYTIWNANNFESNPTVYVGNMRMQFSF